MVSEPSVLKEKSDELLGKVSGTLIVMITALSSIRNRSIYVNYPATQHYRNKQSTSNIPSSKLPTSHQHVLSSKFH
jgi:hypothetical protein